MEENSPSGEQASGEQEKHSAIKRFHFIEDLSPHELSEGDFNMVAFFDRFENNLKEDGRPPEQWLARLRVQARDGVARRMVDRAIPRAETRNVAPQQQYEWVRDLFFLEHEDLYGPRVYLSWLVETMSPNSGRGTKLVKYDRAETIYEKWAIQYENARSRLIKRDGWTVFPAHNSPDVAKLLISMCWTAGPVRRRVNHSITSVRTDEEPNDLVKRFLKPTTQKPHFF